ncbi:hypothetical protein [Streptomyces prasinus]
MTRARVPAGVAALAVEQVVHLVLGELARLVHKAGGQRERTY